MRFKLIDPKINAKVEALLAAGEGEIDSMEVVAALMNECKKRAIEPRFWHEERNKEGVLITIEYGLECAETAIELNWDMRPRGG